MDLFFFLYVLILFIVILMYEILRYKEKIRNSEDMRWIISSYEKRIKDLNDRLMSKSLPEFKAVTKDKEKKPSPKNFMKQSIENSYRYKD